MKDSVKEKVRHLIKHGGAALKGKYIENGKTCIIGALCLRAGMTEDELARFGSRGISELSCKPLLSLLEEKFGIDKAEAEKLQQVNDYADDSTLRQGRLLAFIDRGEVVIR